MENFNHFLSQHPPPIDCSILFYFQNITLTDILPDLQFFPQEIYILNNQIELFIDEFNEIGTISSLKNAQNHCQAIIDWSWERLNIGTWSKVDINYRLLFAYHKFLESVLMSIRYRVLKNENVSILDSFISLLEPLDQALIMSPDFSLPNLSLTRIANSLHQNYIIKYLSSHASNGECITRKKFYELKDKLQKKEFQQHNILVPKMKNSVLILEKEHSLLDLFTFEKTFLVTNLPVKITGAMEYWPCRIDNSESTNRVWTFENLLDRMAFRTVPIELGNSYTANNWSQKIVKFIDFVSEYVSGVPETIGYLAQYGLFEQIPQMSTDFIIPDYCAASRPEISEARSVDINVWIGPAGTVSPLHTDPRDNIFVQVLGRKYVRLISSEVSSEQLYPFDGLQSNTSQVNLEHPDSICHSAFCEIDSRLISETVIQPGEMLFIPRGTWHFVKSLEPSISLSFWFN